MLDFNVNYISISAVRGGNLADFSRVLETHKGQFENDNTYILIERLRHNVIKTGVRMINLSYLKISLSDVAEKLLLDTREDAEYIVAKVGVCERVVVYSFYWIRGNVLTLFWGWGNC